MDDSELWCSDEEEECCEGEESPKSGDPTLLKMDLGLQGMPGEYHVRNKPGEKQRKAISMYEPGPKKKPAFSVSCTARVIVHGTVEAGSPVRATLLVYDFLFFSYRSARIKSANIEFEFHPKKGSTAGGAGPTVRMVAPFATHMMMWTPETDEQTLTWEIGGGGSPFGPDLSAKTGGEGKRGKTTTHSAEVTGSNPFDSKYGDYYKARWYLEENNSQRNGIVSQLRTCILLTRDNDEEFDCFPTLEVTPDLKTRAATLFSRREPDDPIILDPGYQPYNTLVGLNIDASNLGSVQLDQVWDCTFKNVFGGALKDSRSRVEVRFGDGGSLVRVDKFEKPTVNMGQKTDGVAVDIREGSR